MRELCSLQKTIFLSPFIRSFYGLSGWDRLVGNILLTFPYFGGEGLRPFSADKDSDLNCKLSSC